MHNNGRLYNSQIEDFLQLRPQTTSFSAAMAEYSTIGRDTGVIRSVPLYRTRFCFNGVPLPSRAMTTQLRESFHDIRTQQLAVLHHPMKHLLALPLASCSPFLSPGYATRLSTPSAMTCV